MNTELLKEQWAPYEPLVSFGTLMRLISRPCDYLQQEPSAVIPSIELAVDGPVLRSVFLFTDDYICEARLAENSESFDASLLRTIENYRLDIGTHEVKHPEPAAPEDPKGEPKPAAAPKKITYQTAKVFLAHAGFMRTEISYVGNERETWLRNLRNALPFDVLKQSKAP